MRAGNACPRSLRFLAEAHLEFDLTFNVALIPRNVHAPEIAWFDFARLWLRAGRELVATGWRRWHLGRVAAEAGHFVRQPVKPAREDRVPAVCCGNRLLDIAQDGQGTDRLRQDVRIG